MNLITEISFLFGWIFSMFNTITTENAAISCSAKFADCKGKTVNHKYWLTSIGKTEIFDAATLLSGEAPVLSG